MKKVGTCLLFVFLFFSCAHTQAQDTTMVSLTFAGDIMQHDSQIADAYDETSKTYHYFPCFQFVKPYLEAADVAIGNLELTLAGPPYKGYPQFSAPDQLAITLRDVGFDVLVTANNHSMDRGKLGLERTIQVLDSFNIAHTGTFIGETDRLNNYPLLIERNGMRLALLNYTYGTNGIAVTKPNIVNHIDTAQIRMDLQKAKRDSADASIVFVHWGSEYQSRENALQRALTEFCFKHGALMVIGAHPHVLQPMEWRKDKNQLVAYSLGNFVSGQRDRYKNGGAMVNVVLKKITNGRESYVSIDSASHTLVYVHRTPAQKEYFLLPAPTFENDTTNFIKDEPSKLMFKTFLEDSRKLLLNKHDFIPELTTQPARRPDE